MVINKGNLDLIDVGDLCLHDLLISALDLNVEKQILTARISDYCEEKLTFVFGNVVEFNFSLVNRLIVSNSAEIFGWEAIPCEHNAGSFIVNEKIKSFEQGRPRNDNLFAVRFLLTSGGELKIVCEHIHIT